MSDSDQAMTIEGYPGVKPWIRAKRWLRHSAQGAVISLVCVGLISCGGTGRSTPSSITMELIASVPAIGSCANDGNTSCAEVPAYDPMTRRLFVVNGTNAKIDVYDLTNPASPRALGELRVAGFIPNSIAVANGLLAVALEAVPKTAAGRVAIFRTDVTPGGSPLSLATVGALPDQLTFTPDGQRILVANEGEPNSYGQADSVDPEGSVSIINIVNPAAPTVSTASFARFNGQEASLRAQGIRIFGPNATAAQDFEPEYIAVSEDGSTAFVTLQENNALAVVDIATATVTRLVPLGSKDHGLPANGMDVSDSGTTVNIAPRPGVRGLYQPDAIAAYRVGNETFLITANEGDSREYTGFNEVLRVNAASVTLDASAFPTGTCGGISCKDNTQLGRLQITNSPLSTLQSTSNLTTLFAFGARSFSIWSASSGALVWDSGNELETRTNQLSNSGPGFSFNFNGNHSGGGNNAVKNRSPSKGPEPEGVAIGRFGDQVVAFIGLERVGGVMMYDVTDPRAPRFLQYLNPRNGTAGDRGAEVLTFVPADRSPTGDALLLVGNEISGTTSVIRVRAVF